MNLNRYAVALAVLTTVVPGASGLGAQERYLAIHAGVAEWDLSGTGQAATGAVRAGWAVTRVIGLEANVGFLRPSQGSDVDGDARNSLFLPELHVQFTAPGKLAPYLGLGGGAAIQTSRGNISGDTRVTGSGALGVRYAIATNMRAVGEVRVRGVGSGFEGSVADLTFGLALGF